MKTQRTGNGGCGGMVSAMVLGVALAAYWLAAPSSACCLLVVDAPAKAEHGISCWSIRPYVWIYGEAAAVEWARTHGYTAAQIMAVKRRCKA